MAETRQRSTDSHLLPPTPFGALFNEPNSITPPFLDQAFHVGKVARPDSE
jgi:hypothetical protein